MGEVSSDYVLILAGGSGTRFWPLSRAGRPKQLLDLFGKGSMLVQAVRRAASLVPVEHIFILTNAEQLEEVQRQVSELINSSHIVAEPLRRDTAPAVALGVGLIAARDSQARMLVMPSDALVGNDGAFVALAREALDLAGREPALITIGIRPTWACPSYGYIERAEEWHDAALSHTCYNVARFCEKPDAATAARYLESGRFCWNAGMFVWSVPTVQAQLEAHCPQLADFAAALAESTSPHDFIAEHFLELTPISIDYARMEKADRVLNFEATFEWDDVGSWISLGERMPADAQGNAANTPLTVRAAMGNIVYAAPGKQVALLGVSDLIVVDTSDALLVARKEDADRIKQIVEQLPPQLT